MSLVTSTFDEYPLSPATLQLSSGEANGSKILIPCSFSGMEGKRMILEVPQRVGMSSPVSVEYNDAMFLGEVMVCRPGNAGSFRVEIQVEQILTGLQSLIALRTGLLGASGGAPAKPQNFVPVNARHRDLRN